MCIAETSNARLFLLRLHQVNLYVQKGDKMNKGITVNQLLNACKKEVENGNGEKIVMISSDDEGNAYHTLWYSFLSETSDVRKLQNLFHDKQRAEDVVILG